MLFLGEQACSDKKHFNFMNFINDLLPLHSSSEHIGKKSGNVKSWHSLGNIF